jgi:hypothetical protein
MNQVVKSGNAVSEPYNFWLDAQTHLTLTSWSYRIEQVDEVTEENGEEENLKLTQCVYYLKEMAKKKH